MNSTDVLSLLKSAGLLLPIIGLAFASGVLSQRVTSVESAFARVTASVEALPVRLAGVEGALVRLTERSTDKLAAMDVRVGNLRKDLDTEVWKRLRETKDNVQRVADKVKIDIDWRHN